MPGGLGLLSSEGGERPGKAKGWILWGSIVPSKAPGIKPSLLFGNCFWRRARKSSSGSWEKDEAWERSQRGVEVTPGYDSIELTKRSYGDMGVSLLGVDVSRIYENNPELRLGQLK
jgi:hypothetical protein